MNDNPGNKLKEFKILAIYGSPRKKGNTSILLDRFIEGATEPCSKTGTDVIIKKIAVSDLNISPCRGCHNCSRTGGCIVDDDMQQVYKELAEADFLAVASPVFFTTVSGYLKALIDRCQRFWSLKYEHKEKIITKKRKGIFISTAGSAFKDIFDCPRKVIRSFFDVLYVDYLCDFVFNNVDKQGDILKDDGAVETLYRFGKDKSYMNRKGKQLQ
jgi:NAD(P)H-dependent FMN reductase